MDSVKSYILKLLAFGILALWFANIVIIATIDNESIYKEIVRKFEIVCALIALPMAFLIMIPERKE